VIAELRLHLDADAIEPGEQITGRVMWSAKVESLEVQLRWETSGKGDKDTAIVARAAIVIPDHEAREARFALTAPEQPFSFSGTLISLTYYVRVVDTAGGQFETEIVIAPGGKEIRLAGA
jgi:hypothetical protein